MSTFKLSLPTDIPWRRICVSTDMMDPVTCDDERPARWHSSLAAFRYDPAAEYQPYENDLVSYIKIVATIAPFQWSEPGITPSPEWVPPELLDEVEKSHPCYGAVLQVSVGPTAHDKNEFSLQQYPYFIECEPKKRELYEQVTDTGELLSASSTNLNVGKASTSVHSTEGYDLDMGGSVSWNIGFMSGVNAGSVDDRKQVGTIKKDSTELTNVRTSDLSTERRELQSHTTQLTQMYTLFQAYHLGTNRALFFIEPRPHVRQSETTFINGPRAIEGMQEVFLVVVRPRRMTDFCIGALLETAHITYEPQDAVLKVIEQQLHRTFELVFEFMPQISFKEVTYDIDSGFEMDTTKGSGGYSYDVLEWDEVEEFDVAIVNFGHALRVSAKLKPRGRIKLEIIIYERQVTLQRVAPLRSLFLSARELCCCPPQRLVKPGWISAEIDLSRYKWQAYVGPGSPQRFFESRQIAATVRDEMIRSFTSSKRRRRGEMQYVDSDAFVTGVAAALTTSRFGPNLHVPLTQLDDLDDRQREQLSRLLSVVTVGDFLRHDGPALARVLQMPVADVLRLKTQLVRRATTSTR